MPRPIPVTAAYWLTPVGGAAIAPADGVVYLLAAVCGAGMLLPLAGMSPILTGDIDPDPALTRAIRAAGRIVMAGFQFLLAVPVRAGCTWARVVRLLICGLSVFSTLVDLSSIRNGYGSLVMAVDLILSVAGDSNCCGVSALPCV
ncbi:MULTISPECIES: hypothetical protein [unclassified Crossiella]|uniref:hypothetical protein n=1 Tax=unclassified Crossiella TaxID=2620835 RepID=UPI0020002D79|nr:MULTISPECIES: hypothetical protein [unclassified Crossiella]MCK2245421.1 hypothetical protein [Crossiella sp. S99.2]MCK2259073.1 hypothetical protein [Crossiella sp. S99.1]